MMFARDPCASFVHPRLRTTPCRAARSRAGARARAAALRPSAARRRCISSATTQTSPMLLRLPAALRVRPVDVRREQPVRVHRADKLHVVVSERGRVLLDATTSRSTRPRFRSSAVSGLPSGPLLTPTASNCCSCFGNTLPPTRAMPACGTHLDAVDLVVDDERRGLDGAADRHVARADRRRRRHVHFDGDLVGPSR